MSLFFMKTQARALFVSQQKPDLVGQGETGEVWEIEGEEMEACDTSAPSRQRRHTGESRSS